MMCITLSSEPSGLEQSTGGQSVLAYADDSPIRVGEQCGMISQVRGLSQSFLSYRNQGSANGETDLPPQSKPL